MLDANLLKEITGYANQYDAQGIAAPILEKLRAMGEGELYFLSNTFAPEAIYYNKDLLLQYGLPGPQDFMPWQDVLALAHQVAERGREDSIQGLTTPHHGIADLFLHLGTAEGLTWYHPANHATLFGSEAWKTIVKQLVQKDKDDHRIPPTDDMYSDGFVDGKIAMVLDDYALVDRLKQSKKKINWALVTAPVSPDGATKSQFYSFETLNGINHLTSQFEVVLEVWAYLNGQEMAKIKHNGSFCPMTLPIRSGIVQDKELKNISAFYQIAPDSVFVTKRNDLPLRVKGAIKTYLRTEIQRLDSDNTALRDESVLKWEHDVAEIIRQESRSNP
ncbi:periplasmic component [Paenibacillus popilliae ATCC 14706]|uniref:Periplasmic component n=1 Tax=Paenibacillus popilliae ATCC 14706 TaxID=1212764 RepID=M9M3P4_PAEPP|nr:periplasmic component [Paenibacillus popilliae ATCC 14706]